MPRGLPRGEGPNAPAVNACTAAVFFMGFNLGLTVLLAVVIATHSPAAFSAPLDPPAYLRAQGILGGGSSAVMVSASNDATVQVQNAFRPPLPSGLSGIDGKTSAFNSESSVPVGAVKLSPPCMNSTKSNSAARLFLAHDQRSSQAVIAAGANGNSTSSTRSRISIHRLPSAAFMARRRHEAEASCRARPRGCKVSKYNLCTYT